MAVEGTLDLFQLPEILQMISRQRKTGILTVQGEEDIVAISFAEGGVVGADALNQTSEEGLWEVFEERGALPRAQYSKALNEAQRDGGRIIDILVERDYLTRSQVLEALRVQTVKLLLEVLSWHEGDFKFYRGDEVSHEEGFRPIPAEELLLARAEVRSRAAGEEPVIAELETTYRRRAPRGKVVVRAEDELPSPGERETPGVVRLTPLEKEVLDRLDGHRTALDLVGEEGLSEVKVRYALFRLLENALIEPVASGAAHPTPAAEPAPSPRPAPPAPVVVPGRKRGPVERRTVRREAEPAARGRRSREVLPIFERWSGRTLGLVLAAVLVATGLLAPSRLLLPFPWDAARRTTLDRVRLDARYDEIECAAGTFFLLEGYFPDDLGRLVTLGLLGSSALQDPAGRPLGYEPQDSSYKLEPRRGDKPVPELEHEVSIRGNFLLDPESLHVPEGSESRPLVLLD